jgi:short-subunit dehydrogenase
MTDSNFATRYGPWALVTGASQGIGASLSMATARLGCNVVLVARNRHALEQQAASVASLGVQTRVVEADLATAQGVIAAVQATAGLEVGLLVCNAAHARVGNFLAGSPSDVDHMLDVNCRATAHLCHALAPPMVARGRGGIVILSSLSALVGSPGIAAYAASKAFDLIFAEGLGSELAPHGVDVLAVLAGATSTPGYHGSSPSPTGAGTPSVMSPEDVASQALAALGHQPTVIPGAANRLGGFVMQRLLSRKRAVKLMHNTARTMYGPRLDTPRN